MIDFGLSLFTIYLQRFGMLNIYIQIIYAMVNVQRFTKSLPKFVYVIYKAFPKFWLEFVYNWFTGSLRNNFGVRLPRFIYQSLVNEQPWNILYFFDFSTSCWEEMNRFYWMYWIFLLFDLSTSCWEFKLIGFTEYIGFFWLYDFSNCWWEVKIIDFTEYIDFFRLFDFSTSWWLVKMIDFTE